MQNVTALFPGFLLTGKYSCTAYKYEHYSHVNPIFYCTVLIAAIAYFPYTL